MIIKIGKYPSQPGGFCVIGDSGRDITNEMCVKSVVLQVDGKATRATVTIEVYSEVEIETDFVAVEIKKS